MNFNLIQQLMKCGNPQQAIMNMMTPQQKMMAESFLSNPNREQALQDLMKQNNISQQQVDSLKNIIK